LGQMDDVFSTVNWKSTQRGRKSAHGCKI